MSGTLKLGLIIIAAVLVVGLAVKLVSSLLGLLIPIAVIGGIGLILYSLAGRKAIGGRRRRYLP